MYRIGLLIIGLLAASVPGFVGHGDFLREEPPKEDPLVEVAQALDQGRHWYAARLLQDLDGTQRQSPDALLLAAKAVLAHSPPDLRTLVEGRGHQ